MWKKYTEIFNLAYNREEFVGEGLYGTKQGEVYTISMKAGEISLLTVMPFLRKKWIGDIQFTENPLLVNMSRYNDNPEFFDELEQLKWKGLRRVYCDTEESYERCIRECKECI